MAAHDEPRRRRPPLPALLLLPLLRAAEPAAPERGAACDARAADAALDDMGRRMWLPLSDDGAPVGVLVHGFECTGQRASKLTRNASEAAARYVLAGCMRQIARRGRALPARFASFSLLHAQLPLSVYRSMMHDALDIGFVLAEGTYADPCNRGFGSDVAYQSTRLPACRSSAAQWAALKLDLNRRVADATARSTGSDEERAALWRMRWRNTSVLCHVPVYRVAAYVRAHMRLALEQGEAHAGVGHNELTLCAHPPLDEPKAVRAPEERRRLVLPRDVQAVYFHREVGAAALRSACLAAGSLRVPVLELHAIENGLDLAAVTRRIASQPAADGAAGVRQFFRPACCPP